MEQIIEHLLAADSISIQQATAELNEAYKHPETIPSLCNIVVSGKSAHIRQYAAVLLRKRLAKKRNWQLVSSETQKIIKNGMLKALLEEPEKSVRNAIAQFIGIIIHNESQAQNESWMTEILQVIFKYTSSSNVAESELGSSIFATLTDVVPDQFIPHMSDICKMFSVAMMATENVNVTTSPVVIQNILIGMNYLVPFVTGQNTAEHTYAKAIPSIVKSLRSFAALPDPDQFLSSFDILENMADYTPKLLNSNLKLLVDFCIEIGQSNQLDPAIRIKVVAYIGWLVRIKKKTIVKQKLLEPILQVVFRLMCTEPDLEEDDDEYFLGQDSTSPMTTAAQTMDMCALSLPPEKFIPPLLQMLEVALQGQDPLARRAAYLAMAVIAEGCSETICSKYLETMLNIIKVGLGDPSAAARSAAFFALGQFSEYLQPDITKYAPQILPILGDYLHKICVDLRNGIAEPKHTDRMFYALDTFCENLDENLAPYLPMLMERIFEAMNPAHSTSLREMCFSCTASIAVAVKHHFLPYFHQMIAVLQPYLVKSDQEDLNNLRPEAIDTLASLTRNIGKDNFMPMATDTMNYALMLLQETDEPDLRRAIYNLLGALSEVVENDMSTAYPKIVPLMLETLSRPDDEDVKGIKEDTPSSADESVDEDIDIARSDTDEKEEKNDKEYNVENPYLDEKEEIVITLKEFAVNSSQAFIPYIEKSFEEVYKKIDHPNDEMRKGAIECLSAFIIALFRENNLPAVKTAVMILQKKLYKIIHDDDNTAIVMAAMEGLSDLLKELKEAFIANEEQTEGIYVCIINTLQGKLACQFEESERDDEDSEDDCDETEFEEALIETAGNMLPLFGAAIQPQLFDLYFTRTYNILLMKLNKAKKNGDMESHRAFVYGALAECFEPLKQYAAKYFDTLCPIMLGGLTDESDQARQNAVFGLGELVVYSGEKSFGYYSTILNALSQSFASETKPSAVDNICGAVARLITTNSSLVPLAQVLPVFLQKLPLREDFQENSSIFKCLKLLLLQEQEAVNDFVEQILAVVIHVLYQKQYNDNDTYLLGVGIVNDIRMKFVDKFNALASNNVEMINFLNTL